MCLMEMSTISKTNPNANQSSKTNDGLNPVADIPPISTLTPPVTIYGVSPQLYIGQNGASRSTFSYSTSVFQITTQDNSFFKLDSTNSYLNKSLAVHTGTNAVISVGVSPANSGTILYTEYAPAQWLLQLSTQFGTTLQLQDSLTVVNTDFQILKPMAGGNITFKISNADGDLERQAIFKYTETGFLDEEGAQLEISVPGNTSIFPNTPGSTINLLQDKINLNIGAGKLEVTPTLTYTTTNFTLLKASTIIDFILQNNTVTAPTQRRAIIEYFESGNPGSEGGALSLTIPANTRRVPVTAGASLILVDDTIALRAKEVQLQDTPLNANSYLYLNNFKSLSNTQPAPTTWTPTLFFSTATGNSVAYTTRYGLCWKYGNISYVVFGIVATITIATVTNVFIQGNLTYDTTTQLTDINFNNQSFIATTRYNMSSASLVNQTTPSWIIGLLNIPGLNLFVRNEYWQSGTGTTDVAFYGEGFLCHA